ncbi:ComF family protein [Phosphitispora fastidiosa]|uniref:ComF family protein n=1 Tax=Phosphitispora fastidiosa TaxID=2837202 RepID=UPI001E593C35|nr:ComF family protein [Phosphitispora fastidiosa]MBU7006419.1 ComF family protein [Phosphitispora fastidiosa]
MGLLEKMLQVLFPEKSSCLVCGCPAGTDIMCEGCMQRIVSRQGFSLCPRCGRYMPEAGEGGRYCPECREAPPAFFMARSLGPYGGDLKQVIYMYKYSGYRSLCGSLGLLMAELFLREQGFWDSDIIVPVPLSEEKLRIRGFNQSELLAERMGQLLHLPVARCLLRTIDTHSQSKLTRQERQDNIRGAFTINRQAWPAFTNGATERPYGKVLLVDDILTTGATVGECSRVMLRAGAENIGVITLASGLQGKI